MIGQSPINPDALEAAERWMQEKAATFGLHWKNAKPIIETYLAAALPEVTSVEELEAPALPRSYQLPSVSRVEVISNGGRELLQYGASDVFFDLQDGGRTLKVFMRVPEVKP